MRWRRRSVVATEAGCRHALLFSVGAAVRVHACQRRLGGRVRHAIHRYARSNKAKCGSGARRFRRAVLSQQVAHAATARERPARTSGVHPAKVHTHTHTRIRMSLHTYIHTAERINWYGKQTNCCIGSTERLKRAPARALTLMTMDEDNCSCFFDELGRCNGL